MCARDNCDKFQYEINPPFLPLFLSRYNNGLVDAHITDIEFSQ